MIKVQKSTGLDLYVYRRSKNAIFVQCHRVKIFYSQSLSVEYAGDMMQTP